ncbi:MAG: acyltransferase [Rikenella sp.]|nr:acyltransferase [Rikenella sp.]
MKNKTNSSPVNESLRQNDLRSQALDLLRFPLAVIIVLIHTFNTGGLTVQGQVYNTDQYPIFIAINRFIDGFLRGQSVPIYFFISGFVFFLGVEWSRKVYLKKLKNRVKTLLIPYIIWNTVSILWLLSHFLPCFSTLFPDIHAVKLDFSISAILQSYWNAAHGIFIYPPNIPPLDGTPQNAPLWFLRDLMVVVISSPLLYLCIKRLRHYWVIALGVLWFFNNYWSLSINFLAAFFFFSWGAYMSINRKDMLAEFGRFFKSSAFLYPTLALLYVAAAYYWPEATGTIKTLNVFVGLIFAYNLSAWLLRHKICTVSRFLASSSFFLYITHGIICNAAVKGVFYFLRPTSDLGIISVYTLATCLTITILLSSFYLLKRYTPGLLKVLTGRR